MISAVKPRQRTKFTFQLVGIAFLCAGAATAAQDATQLTRAAASLPTESRTVIKSLMSLREMPDGAWKYHTGDLAHGEDVNLDDSGWPVMPVGTTSSKESVWFRQTVEVPQSLHGYNLTGARIWFEFHADANGPLPEIIYLNGRRVALGEALEPIVLFENAQPGAKAVVAVELLHTVDSKHFRGATMHIDYAPSRPNPVDLAEEFLSAAELIPSLAPGDAAPMSTLDGAIHAVDLGALDGKESGRFDASLKAAQGQMEALRPLLRQATFHLDGDAHIDAAWLWPWPETVGVVKNTFSTALQLMYEYPGYKFTQSAAAYNAWMMQDYPDISERIKERIQEGRWEIVGGMWVEPDLNLPDGESLVRQLLIGKRWFKNAYGVDVRIGWNPDSFGYSWQLPQIYKKSGVDYFVTQKMSWNDTNPLPFKLFWWESPDGSKVLTYFPHEYGNTAMNPLRLGEDMTTARSDAPGLPELLDLYGIGDHGGGPTRVVLDEAKHWMDYGAEGTAANGGAPVTPKYEFGAAQSFFSEVEKQIAPESRIWNYPLISQGYEPPAAVAGKIAIPTWNSELYLEYHRGVYTTQAQHKHSMRVAEEEMLNAEKWSSLAWVMGGQAYPANDLTEDWKKVLFNQFHDLAAGSGIAAIYKDAQKDYDWVRMSTDEISSASLQAVAEHINTQAPGVEIPVVVWNPLGWERRGDITVKVQAPTANMRAYGWNYDPRDHGSELARIVANDAASSVATLELSNVRVPAFGYTVVYLHPAPSAVEAPPAAWVRAEQTPTSYSLNNSALRVTVDRKTGCITSIVRHPEQSENFSQFEALAAGGCGNQLQFFKDTPKDYDAWNIDPGTLDAAPSVIEDADSVELVNENPRNAAVRVVRHWQSSKLVQNIRLQRDLVDIDTDIDWHETHVLLKAAFPLAVTSNFATYEIPYGSIERPTTRDNSWEKAKFEVPALRWADLSGVGAGVGAGEGAGGKVNGLSLLNQDKYGYDAAGNVLRLTLLRSPTWPDPDADRGHQHFHYALYPHSGTWKDALTMHKGWEYDYPLEAVATTAHAGSMPAQHSFASVGPDSVILTAIKKAEDANALIFRAYEWGGKETTAEFHIPPGAISATVTNLMEKPEGGALTIAGDMVRVPMHPYEILTLRVDYAPAGAK
jgi:alpha-mannosidase